jgi:hypothetical protein
MRHPSLGLAVSVAAPLLLLACGTSGKVSASGAAATPGTGGGAGVPGTGGAPPTSTGGTTGTATGGGTGAGAWVYPLKLAPGQRHLVDQNGQPFLLIGDAAWSLLVSLSDADAKTYLADRAAKGFDAVLVNLIEHKFAPSAPANAAGDLPFTGKLSGGALDFSTPNEAYFAHVDQVLNDAAARGIVVLLAAAYLGHDGGDEGWYTQMQANGASRLRTYGTYVGQRYKAFPNIVWVAGGDDNPSDKSLTTAVESAIAAADPNHLHTAHADNGTAALDEWGGSSWLTVNNVYGSPGNGQLVYTMALAQYGRSNWQPFFLIESTYEHSPFYSAPAALIRQQAYEAVLNGGFGEVYGNEWVWPFGAVGEDGSAHAWMPALQSQGAQDQTRLAGLLGARDWPALQPDSGGSFLGGAGSGGAHISAALTADGRLAIAYTPGGALSLAMSKLAAPASARWYDPTAGSFTPVTGSPFANSGSHTFMTPGKNAAGDADWVLVLEAN